MHSILEQRKQYISVGKTDLFYNSMGLCGNFTEDWYTFESIKVKVTRLTLKTDRRQMYSSGSFK